ncbi:oligosaccharide flippase family protein [Vibrio sp. Sgm 22]|uniref:oligosaccharide flippase family protein n=1 Tax=unclassified Vibrio TaxID=2614977 RepID=UPI002248E492|nr:MULTISPECIES: oligosaccharide flippase family protein [unclassified Vibrio]MCX2758274.1 oligosaccharide flippase family protein [Vibrio sp. 14G-20]MCX2775366.1 oligosaccharide flippase family protein [Vibrio sp. Sgm 22]
MKIIKDSIVYVSGEVLTKLIPFLMLPYLTRELGPSQFGELANTLAYVAMVSIFVGLSQEGALARYYYRYGFKAIHLVYVSCVVYSLGAVFTISLFIYLFSFDDEVSLFILLLSLSQTLLTSQLSLKQVQKKPKDYVFIQVTCSLASVILTITFFELFGSTYELRLLSVILANLLSLCVGTYLNSSVFFRGRSINIKTLKKTNKYIVFYGAPLLVHKVSFFVKGNVDKIVVFNYFSAEELGSYSAAFQLSSVVMIVLASMNKALVPYYYEALKSGSLNANRIKSFAFKCYPLIALVSLPFFFIPDEVYIFVLGKGYDNVAQYVGVFVLGFALQIPYYLTVNFYFYHAKTVTISKITFFSSFLYILSLFFFSRLSIAYIPYALVIANLSSSIFLIILLNRSKNEKVL